MTEALWTAVLNETISNPPILVEETVLLATRPPDKKAKHCTLQGISLADGQPRWQHTFDFALISGMQTYHLLAEGIDIGVVATGSTHFLKGQGGVFAFNEMGEIVWQWQGEAQHYSAPMVMARQLLVIAGAKTLAIISPDPEGGAERHIPLPVNGSAAATAVHNGIIYIPCRSPELLALDLNGDIRWHFQFEANSRDWLEKTPLVTDEYLYTVSSLGSFFALETLSGNLAWQENLGVGRSLSQPALANGRLYVGTKKGLVVLDARNGSRLWALETTRPISAAPLVIGNSVYATCEDHHLYVLDVETGEEQWQVEMARRIEMPPILTPTALLLVDRGGMVMALPPPVIPDDGGGAIDPEARQRQQQLETAVALGKQGEHLQAAELWFELGELEKAAQEHELADNWLKAAEIWLQLDRYGKRAQALERHAKFLSKQQIDPEEKAQAWEQAARAYIETGQTEERLKCEREVSRYRQQPILNLEIEAEELVLNVWSKLNFSVHNNGFGIARFVTVMLKSEQRFEGKGGRTKTTPTITPGNSFTHLLDICPRQQGSRVPLRLKIEYTDKSKQIHILERTFPVEVAGPQKVTTTAPVVQSDSDPDLDTDEMLADLPVPENINLNKLRSKISQYFSSDDLETIFMELNLDPEEFIGSKSKRALKLLLFLIRRNRLEELLDILQRERPRVHWQKIDDEDDQHPN